MSPVRFVFAVLVFLVSTLVMVPAPNLLLWQVKVGATEYGAWFFIAALVLMAFGRKSTMDSVSVFLSAFAAVLLLLPPVGAIFFASGARESMRAVFPPRTDAPRPAPFTFLRCWTVSKVLPVEVETHVFAQRATGDLSLDFYIAGNNPAPCVLVLHTGGWENGTRKEFQKFNHYLARRGIAVASMDYRLAPRNPWPAQRDDTRAAIAFLVERSAELGIDPRRIVLMGRSAGGQIAQAVAAAGDSGAAGCIGFYTPTDMRFAFQYADQKDILNSYRLLVQYLGGTPQEVGANYNSATAYGRVGRGTPPMLIVHGAEDELVWCKQSERFAENLKTAGVRHVFLKLPWATHAFDYRLEGPGGQIGSWAVEAFVNGL